MNAILPVEELVVTWHCKPYAELTTVDLYAMLAARAEVFIMEQQCNYLDTDGYDDRALHLWATHNGEIAAYCRLFAPGIKYADASIGRVLTTAKYRGKSLGKTLMRLAIEVLQTLHPGETIRISAQDYLLRFYGELGFLTTEKKYLEDQIPHTEMYLPAK